MKLSKFNELHCIDNDLFIYNHLSKRIVKITETSIIPTRDELINNKKLLLGLQKNEMVVNDFVNEDFLAELSLNDYIFDKALRLVLLPSEDCNFRCTFCYEKFESVRMNQDVLDSLHRYLRKNITKFAELSVDWFGGEPLLAIPEITDFSTRAIALATKAKIPYHASMTTNAYLLNIDTMRDMLKLKINSFHITLCGFKDEHDSIRYLKNGGGTFDVIIKNLLDIRSLIQSRSFRIIIRINVAKRTLDTFEEFIAYLDDMFGGDDRFTFYFRPIGDWGGSRVKEISEDLYVTKEQIFERVLTVPSRLNYDIYYSLLSNNICAASKRNNFVIRANGDINKCTESLYTDYNNVGKLQANGEFQLNAYSLSRWLNNNSEKFEKCSSCFKYALCRNKKCPDNLFKTDRIIDSYCGYEDLSILEILKLLNTSNSKHIFTIA